MGSLNMEDLFQDDPLGYVVLLLLDVFPIHIAVSGELSYSDISGPVGQQYGYLSHEGMNELTNLYIFLLSFSRMNYSH